jgi:zinc protease
MRYLTCLRFIAAVAVGCIAASGNTLQAQEPQSWPQSRSDIPADPDIRFGILPNGMRFAIMHNATPPGQAAIRFRIGAGSLNEIDEQQGLAHFLEHMAFKGSAHVPEGEMIRILQRKGLAFGPDTNANTAYDETVYSLDLPEVDADTLSTGLMLMRETASELTLDAGAFDRERGVILSEERLRDTPQYRASIGVTNLLLEGQRATLRSPIGKIDIIKNAPVDRVRDFYNANYRPDRATLMVVGDVDPAALEADIRKRFSDWQPRGAAVAEPDLGGLKAKTESADVITVPGSATNVQIIWTRPFDTSLDTYAKRRQQLVEDLGLLVLRRRLSTIASKPNAPFTSADAGSQDLLESAHAVMIAANGDPEKWQAALSSIDQEQRRLLQFGVSQPELDREITEYRALLQSAASGAATRTSTGIASTLAYTVDTDQVYTSPSEDLALFERMTKDIQSREINKALPVTFSGNGPQVMLLTPAAPKGGADELRKTYDASRAIAVTAPVAAADIAWPYTDFGAPGTVVERHVVDDLGLTMVKFANGVRLTVKPTKLRADEVLVREDIGHGRIGLPKDQASVLWASPAVILSGVKAMDYPDIQRVLAANVVGIDFSVGDSSFRFNGQTRSSDLQKQLQLMAAYTSDPAYRPEVFDRVKQAYLNNLNQYAATPGGVISRDFAGFAHGGDPRWTFPGKAELGSAQSAEFEKLFRPAVASGPVNITIVGDVTADEAIALTARTFGALPPRPDTAPSTAPLKLSFPAPTASPITETHSGRPDNAAAIVGVPVGDMLSDLKRSFTANLAGQVIQNRLIDQFRIAEGASYGVQADVDLSKDIPGFGYAYIYVDTTPGKLARFYELVDQVTADLRKNTISADELSRARAPVIETMKHQQQGNEYWIEHLQDAQTDPRGLQRVRDNLSGYDNVTAEDIRQFAIAYLKPEAFWKFEVLPAAGQ